jgi:hypothetical protein
MASCYNFEHMFEPEVGHEFLERPGDELAESSGRDLGFHHLSEHPHVELVLAWIKEGKSVWAKVGGEWILAKPTMVTGDNAQVLIRFLAPNETNKFLSTAVSLEELVAWQKEHEVTEEGGSGLTAAA